jgi:hypothetical protein
MAEIPHNQSNYLEAWRRFAEDSRERQSEFAAEGSFRRSSPESVFGHDQSVQYGLRQAGAVIERYGVDLIRYFPQATGVAASLRYVNGEIRNEACITFFVSERLSRRFFGPVPPQIDGVPTDVVEAGTPLLHKATGHVPGLRLRPAEPGMSLSHLRVSSGTFGCLVEDGNRQYILSCAHVLSDTTASAGDPVLQQAPFYGGSSPLDDIARFTRAIPLVSGNCIADAAIAEVIDRSDVTEFIRGIGKPVGTRALSGVGLLVQKSGNMTGLTHGVVTGINGTIGPFQVNGVANVYFTDAILTTGMSEPGDSGSVLMDHQHRAIGLLFGGLQFGSAYVVSWFSPIDTVLSNLGVTLVP